MKWENMKTNKTLRTNFSFIVFLLYLLSKRIMKLHSDIIYLTTSSTVNASYFVPSQKKLKMFIHFYVTGSNALVTWQEGPANTTTSLQLSTDSPQYWICHLLWKTSICEWRWPTWHVASAHTVSTITC